MSAQNIQQIKSRLIKYSKQYAPYISIAAILIGIFLVSDILARINYSATYDEIIKFNEYISKQTDFVYSPNGYKNGNGFLSMLSCSPYSSCPSVAGGGSAAIEPGKEAEFLTKLTKERGYRIDGADTPVCAKSKSEWSFCGLSAHNNKYRVGIYLLADYGWSHKNKNVSPKIWRTVTIGVRPVN